MFKFLKSKNKSEKKGEEEEKVDTEEMKKEEYKKKINEQADIYVMPKKFYFKKINKGLSLIQKSLLGLTLFLIIGIGGAFAFIYFSSPKENKEVEKPVENSPEEEKNIEEEAELELKIFGLDENSSLPRETDIVAQVRVKGESSVVLDKVNFTTPDDSYLVQDLPFKITFSVSKNYKGGNYEIEAFGVSQNGQEMEITKAFPVVDLAEDTSEGGEEGEDDDTTAIDDEEVVEEAEIADADNDGLSDMEEELLGTNLNSKDSDSDGYQDLEEILNSYDPNGTGTLLENENIVEYSNEEEGYKFLTPKKWVKEEIEEANIWLVTSEDGKHFFKVLTQENKDKTDIKDWFKKQFSGDQVSLDMLRKGENWSGIITKDLKTIYLTGEDKSKIFVISYDYTENEDSLYENIFNLLIASFEIL